MIKFLKENWLKLLILIFAIFLATKVLDSLIEDQECIRRCNRYSYYPGEREWCLGDCLGDRDLYWP